MLKHSQEVETMIRCMVNILQPYEKFTWMKKSFFDRKQESEIRAIWKKYIKYVAAIRTYEECGIHSELLKELGERQLVLF